MSNSKSHKKIGGANYKGVDVLSASEYFDMCISNAIEVLKGIPDLVEDHIHGLVLELLGIDGNIERYFPEIHTLLTTGEDDTTYEEFKKGVEESGYDFDNRLIQIFLESKLESYGIYKTIDSIDILLSSETFSEGDARRLFCESGGWNMPVPRFKKLFLELTKGHMEYHKIGDQKVMKIAVDSQYSQYFYIVDSEDTEAAVEEFNSWEKDPYVDAVEKAGKYLTPDKKPSEEIIPEIEATKPIGQYSDKQLIQLYGIDCSDEISDMLNLRAKGNRIIIFKDESTCEVDVDATLSILKQAKRRSTPLQFPVIYDTKTVLKTLYRVGDFPSLTFIECPFHPNSLLFDGYCDTCGHMWEVDDMERLQFARLVYEHDEAPEKSVYIRQFINGLNTSTWDELSIDYPKVYAEFKQRKEDNDLPKLISRQVSRVVENDPLPSGSSHRKY